MQIGPRADVPEWNNAGRGSAPVAPGDASDPAVWAISCFFLRTTARGKGLTHRLVGAGLAFARENGARFVDACPIDHVEGFAFRRPVRRLDAGLREGRVFKARRTQGGPAADALCALSVAGIRQAERSWLSSPKGRARNAAETCCGGMPDSSEKRISVGSCARMNCSTPARKPGSWAAWRIDCASMPDIARKRGKQLRIGGDEAERPDRQRFGVLAFLMVVGHAIAAFRIALRVPILTKAGKHCVLRKITQVGCRKALRSILLVCVSSMFLS